MKPRPLFELKINGRTVRLGECTLIMGVLNVTPDSFSDGGHYLAPERAIEHGLEMARQGADWIDVGGESTRPGSKPIPAEEELRRVLPVIEGLRRELGRAGTQRARHLPMSRGDAARRPYNRRGPASRMRSVQISVDTTKADVAEQAIQAGATILNDVSGLRFDSRLAEVARRHRTPLILMHIRGRPETMQHRPFVRSIWRSVRDGLAWSIRRARAYGVRRSQLIIDPGMGFGKTRRQNFEILAHLDRLQRFGLPILVGTSRKSFIQAVVAGEGLRPSPAKKRRARYWALSEKVGAGSARPREGRALPYLDLGDAAGVAATILGGAHIVRVHDVAALVPPVRIADAILAASIVDT